MMRDATPQTIYLKDYQVPEYLIPQVELNFVLNAEQTRVTSQLTVQRNAASEAQNSALHLMGEDLTLVNIALDGQTLSTDQFTVTPDSLIIHEVPQQRRFILSIENSIHPSANTAFEGLYQSNHMLCTQCEAEGFRKITYFLDRPDVMSQFKTTLIGDKETYPVLLSNGNKIDSGELDNNQHWATWEDPFAKPCYLFALVAGQLQCLEDSFITMSQREIALQIFVEAQDIDKCDHAMQSLKRAMRWDEKVYGREYDLDLYMIVAVSHFNMGAMENKGLNVFNTKFVLARPDTATDTDYEQIEGVIAHEYFHNWTGNRITCRDWFQLSLKEGFTVFRDQQFSGDQTSPAVKRIEDVNLLRTRQFAEDSGPLAHPVRPESYIEINNFYTLTVYEKGAEVVRMLHTLLGEIGFRAGCDLYFQRFDGQAVTCDDFVKAMEEANQKDFTQFKRWYAQAGTPTISVEEQYDEELQQLRLTIKQSCPATPGQSEKLPLHMPIKTGLIAKDGSPIAFHLANNNILAEETILELTEPEQTFVFNKIPEKPVVSLLRGFSAPVIISAHRSEEELAFILSHDLDTFNRWEAAQQLASTTILGLVDAIQQSRPLTIKPWLTSAYQQLLSQSWEDLSYFALLLKLPEESYLATQLSVIDVDALHQAREFVMASLAQQLQEPFQQLYRQHQLSNTTSTHSFNVGQRRIKNVCLTYLTALETDKNYQLCVEQFNQADNMTDQIAALSAIVNSNNPAKENCLDQFYLQWQQQALVIDKWFTLQATSKMPDTFSKVQALMQHSAFDLKTPNRVRSLIGAFSQANPIHFHAQDGSGYRFLADNIVALNTLNPQVASRMVTGLTQWRRYDAHRQQLMQQELQRIVNTPQISKDVYEVANKSL